MAQILVTRLHGGLGNQMFQYAAGRAIALRTAAELYLDLSYFEREPLHAFGLQHFSAKYKIATTSELPPGQRAKPLRYLLWRTLRLNPTLVREKSLGFDPRVRAITPPAYLHGYWQSEKYFADVADIVISDLAVKTPPSQANAAMLERIRGGSSISLHVRRGDYASDPATLATHGLCSPDYYQKAVEAIAKRTGVKSVIYVFSDDPDWAENNLSFGLETVVVRGNTADTNYEDLRLMSACDHHVIANSSFSWWGAWLNPSTDKIVVAPKRWFANPKMYNPDIVPDGWLRV